jgi:hypothetical protein
MPDNWQTDYTVPVQGPDRCETCGDSWHGMPCRRYGCNCPSSFVERDGAA